METNTQHTIITIGDLQGCTTCHRGDSYVRSNPVCTPPESKGVEELKDLERITERGCWWIRLDRAEEILTTHRTQLLREIEGEVERLASKTVWSAGGVPHINRDDILTIIRNI